MEAAVRVCQTGWVPKSGANHCNGEFAIPDLRHEAAATQAVARPPGHLELLDRRLMASASDD